MPVVQLSLDRLQKLIGRKTNKKKILSALPFLGLDIEEQTDSYVRVEYSPNRPDYATDFGIAAGLQGILGIKKGTVKLDLGNGNYKIRVDPQVKKVRPFLSAIVAKGNNLDDETIKQLITLQEDLHFGIGRNRKKTSIGMHDLDKINFPLKYTVVNRAHQFIPLNSVKPIAVNEILQTTLVGKQYGSIVEGSKLVPMILDDDENTISFPPIINSAKTTVLNKTKNLFIEVTATNKKAAEDTISVIAMTLQLAGFRLFSVQISGAGNSSLKLNSKKMILDSSKVNDILGLRLSSASIATSLRKARLDAFNKKNKLQCIVPRYRFDIFGPMDLIEEVVLGYGIEKLEPSLPSSISIGKKNNITTQLDKVAKVLVGLGFSEVMNSSLVGKQTNMYNENSDSSNLIQVAESNSEEQTILRNNILTSLLDNFSRNVHETYPQKLFEFATVFSGNSTIKEQTHLAVVAGHKSTNFSEIKSIFQSFLKITFNCSCETKVSVNPLFTQGRTAEILVDSKHRGVIGEIDSKIIEKLKIRVPLVAFEVQLSGLIFD